MRNPGPWRVRRVRSAFRRPRARPDPCSAWRSRRSPRGRRRRDRWRSCWWSVRLRWWVSPSAPRTPWGHPWGRPWAPRAPGRATSTAASATWSARCSATPGSSAPRILGAGLLVRRLVGLGGRGRRVVRGAGGAVRTGVGGAAGGLPGVALVAGRRVRVEAVVLQALAGGRVDADVLRGRRRVVPGRGAEGDDGAEDGDQQRARARRDQVPPGKPLEAAGDAFLGLPRGRRRDGVGDDRTGVRGRLEVGEGHRHPAGRDADSSTCASGTSSAAVGAMASGTPERSATRASALRPATVPRLSARAPRRPMDASSSARARSSCPAHSAWMPNS